MADPNGTRATATQLGSIGASGVSQTNSVGGFITVLPPVYDRADYFSFTTSDKATYRLTLSTSDTTFDGDVDAELTNAQRFVLGDATITKSSRSEGFEFTDYFANSNYTLNVYRYLSEATSFASDRTTVDYSFTIQPVNYFPDSILVYDLKSSYTMSEAIDLAELYVNDKDGWGDVNSLSMVVIGSDGSSTQTSTNSFTKWSGGTTWAQTNLFLPLSTLNPGKYTVRFNASDSASGFTSLEREITITPTPSIQFSQAVFQADNEGAGVGAITLNRTNNIEISSQVQVNITGGTATTGEDFTRAGFPLIVDFAAGETTKTISIPILQDAIVEGTETIIFSLSSITNSILNGINSTTLQILDDDRQSGGTNGTSGVTGIAPPPIRFLDNGIRRRGNLAPNSLLGRGGDDVLRGGGGNDLLNGKAGRDRLFGDSGNDTMRGGGGADQLDGSSGNDLLFGNGGNDVLVGGTGDDTLTGGGGQDVFVFNFIDEGVDQITDFNVSEDLIDLRPILTQAQFAAENPFAKVRQFVRLQQIDGGTQISIDADGNGVGTQLLAIANLSGVSINSITTASFLAV